MEHAAKLSKHVVDNGINFDFNEIDLKRRKTRIYLFSRFVAKQKVAFIYADSE